MSLAEQERAMFDLLFDAPLRHAYLADPQEMLARYDLTEQEQSDFSSMRPDALEIEGNMRTYMVMLQLCRELPLTCVIASALPGGTDQLKSFVDAGLMRINVRERPAHFGVKVRDWLAQQGEIPEAWLTMLVAILGAELANAMTSASLKQALDNGDQPAATTNEIPQDWITHPVTVASHVSAVVLPQSYRWLKDRLCPCEGEQLWPSLTNEAVPMETILAALAEEDPRLVITRAITCEDNGCDISISQQTIELSSGFASFMQNLNGQYSVGFILEQLKLAGADEQMLSGVETGFLELVKAGMLKLS